MIPKAIPPASAKLIRILIEQNETSLRGMRMRPPTEDGKNRMTLDDLVRQTETLKAKLKDLER